VQIVGVRERPGRAVSAKAPQPPVKGCFRAHKAGLVPINAVGDKGV
jgi:hypothetical protein